MKQKLIAERYAKAVLGILAEKDYAPCESDIAHLREVIRSHPQYIRTLHARLLRMKKRLELVKVLIDLTELKHIWKPLFELLVQKHRMIMIGDILDELELMIHHSTGRVEVKIYLAREISEAVLNKIVSFLAAYFKKEIIVSLDYRKDLLGGFIAETTSVRVDASIKNLLERFAGGAIQSL